MVCLLFAPQFNTLNNALARCPHCRKVSSVGPDFARGRALIFLLLASLALTLAIVITVTTTSYAMVSVDLHTRYSIGRQIIMFLSIPQEHGGIYVAYIAVYLAALFLFARTIYFFNLKVSAIHGPM